MEQTNLEGERIEQSISESFETKAYHVLMTELFKLKIPEEKEVVIRDMEEEERLAWVQNHMRMRSPKTFLEPGDYDMAAETFCNELGSLG